MNQQLDLIIHYGDVVQNGLMEEYAKATKTLSKAKAPVYIVAGNKEDRKNLKNPLQWKIIYRLAQN